MVRDNAADSNNRARKTHDFVVVHNGLKAMGDCDDGDIVLQLRSQRRLNDGIRLVVWKRSACQPRRSAKESTKNKERTDSRGSLIKN